MSRVRTLIVDDSPTMRSLIAAMLRGDPQIEVVGEAGDPLQAREAIKKLDPDVVTLDIEMPNMNGLEFLEKIMRLRPTPVVMVSTLTQAGAEATIRALEIGAVDCVAKPNGDDGARGFAELAEKVKAAARAKLRGVSERTAPPAASTERFAPDGRVVAIGASTGGVEALLTIISRFPANCPPTVITQHMPATFTKSFAERMNRASGAQVTEATDGAVLETGRVYLAPGGLTHLEVVGNGSLRCRLTDAGPVNGHRPSVDVLFNSVAKACGPKAVGALLTGMGKDGARGLLAMKQAGAQTVAQDEATCVVYGMPKAAVELGATTRQAPLERMAPTLLSLCNTLRSETH